MNTSSETNESSPRIVGVLKKSVVVEYMLSPRHLRRARSDVFYTEIGVNSLVVINESDLPENMCKFNIWFYTRAIVKHTLEVSLSLLDDSNRQCYAVDKCLSNSTSETSKVCATVDFSIIPHPRKRFFQGGMLKIQCTICVEKPEAFSSLELSTEAFNRTEDLLKNHLKNIEEAGSLKRKDIFTWTILHSIMKKKDAEVKSDKFEYEYSEFCLSKSKKRFEICLQRNAENFHMRNLRMTLAVLDNMGNMRFTKEEVTQDTSKVFLRYDKVFEDRGTFLDKGELRIYCSLQIDTSSKVPEDSTSKLSGSSEASTSELCRSSEASMLKISSPIEKTSGALSKSSVQIDTSSKVPEDSTSKLSGSSEASTSKLCRSSESSMLTISSPIEKTAGALSKSSDLSLESEFTTKVVAENSLLSSFKVEDKSDVEKALNEMLQLLKEARMETVVIVYKKTK